ncbi:hypothetical protein MP228_005944 [Amoeboaphelidium protococcarum]|nr:hypothetical protein MP228_005944 [Amoeboaphelidium protococcarum]
MSSNRELVTQKLENMLAELEGKEFDKDSIAAVVVDITTVKRLCQQLQDLNNGEFDFQLKKQTQKDLAGYQQRTSEVGKRLDQVKRQIEKDSLEMERSELLQPPQNGDYRYGQQQQQQQSPSSVQQSYQQSPGELNQRIQDSVNRSMVMVDQYIEMGNASLDRIRQQGFTLKNAQRKVYDVANQLGVSNETIRWMERRTTEDKWIFWGGVLITSIIVFIVIYYVIF